MFEDESLLGEEQAGFRSNYSITDNVYVLKSIIDVYLKNSKRLYCAFIDYKKAFDLVDRAALWVKMFRMGVKGKIFNVIRNMYRCAKSCVANEGDMSSLFTCNVGVRQGENLSPLLFAIYLNDFQQSIGNSYKGLEFLNTIIKNKLPFDGIEIYKELFSLLYADDTIILAETPEELQKALNAVKDYCDTWHLTVNASKTKIVVFSRGKVRRIPEFVYDGGVLEVVYDFVYLGVTFNYNGNFKKAIAKQVTQARKAMYSMLVKAKRLHLSVDTQCHLFDHLVLPILLYGAEVWGYECIDQLEVFQRKFLRTILFVNKCTPDCMVYGETGRGKILDKIKCRMIGYWVRLVKGKQSKYSLILFKFLLRLQSEGQSLVNIKSQWVEFLADSFDYAGLGNVWRAQGEGYSAAWIMNTMKTRLSDMSIQEWSAATWSNRICTNYRMFKNELVYEKYLQILCQKEAITLSKFRCRTHRLPVNKGRFDANVVDDLQCPLCTPTDIGDEFHYIFVCPFFQNERKMYIPSNLCGSSLRPSALHMDKVFNTAHACQLKKLAKFVRIIMSYFSKDSRVHVDGNTVNDSSQISNVVRHTRSGRRVNCPVRLDL